ncbi:MAG: hypothetical protein ABI857_03615 [Acidobacteriota bacterium]
MNRTTFAVICLGLFLFCVAGIAQTETPANIQTVSEPTTNSNSPSSGGTGIEASPEHAVKLEQRLNSYWTDYKYAQWRYSWAYHICVYGAAILSALAALLSKVHIKVFGLDHATRRDNWTASLAAVAAVFIAISTAGTLSESWQENMKKRYAVESLLNQLTFDQHPTSNKLEAYGKKLALIIDPNTELVDVKTAGTEK